MTAPGFSKWVGGGGQLEGTREGGGQGGGGANILQAHKRVYENTCRPYKRGLLTNLFLKTLK